MTSTSPSSLDLNMLNSLLEVLGKGSFSGLIDGFVSRADEIVEELKVEGNTPESFHAKAHEMKGMSANYGFPELSAIAKKIEEGSKSDMPQEQIMPLIEKLSDANQRAQKDIKIWLDQQS